MGDGDKGAQDLRERRNSRGESVKFLYYSSLFQLVFSPFRNKVFGFALERLSSRISFAGRICMFEFNWTERIQLIRIESYSF